MSSKFARLLTAVVFVTIAASTQVAMAIECFCVGHCPDQQLNSTCKTELPGASCFTHVEEVLNDRTNQLEIEYTYGCLEEEAALLTCQSHKVPSAVAMNIMCCNNGPKCNLALKPELIRRHPPEEADYNDYTHLAVFLAALVMCLLLGACLFLIFYHRRRKRLESSTEGEHFLPGTSKSLQDLIDCSITSGSGSGLPKMVQRTVARQIEFVCSIGKGRYGEVYKATWKGEFVACKMFYSTEEASWNRETEIYQTELIRHDYILGFIAADIRGTGGWTQLLLITNYHENGSLYDYLTLNSIDEDQAVEMALSACSGICHLHSEIIGKQAKPAIAHRDIKSKNILVKRDGTCCIADFGLAVKFNKATNQIDVGTNTRVGTKRYMAPEVLDETLNTSNFNSYLQADMYSFGLVLWEIASRVKIEDTEPEAYRIPYHEYVPNDPSFEEMRKVVCVAGARPKIPDSWEKNEITKGLAAIIGELWCHKPSCRLTTLRVKKSLSRLEEQLSKRYSSSDLALPV